MIQTKTRKEYNTNIEVKPKKLEIDGAETHKTWRNFRFHKKNPNFTKFQKFMD